MHSHNSKRTQVIAITAIGILAALQPACILATANAQSTPQSAPQSAPAYETAAGGLVIDKPGQVLELDDSVINADVTITGASSGIFVPPGSHVINGNLTIDAEQAEIMIGFNKDKLCGQIEVHGTINLSDENKPTLTLDLANANLMPGETFVILTADAITGEFAGMGNDVAVQIGDNEITLHYADNSISFSVSRPVAKWEPRITPVIGIETDLVDATSTAPYLW